MSRRDEDRVADDPLVRIRGAAGEAPSPRRRLLHRAAVATLVIAAGVALFMPVEMSVTAPGRVVPSDRVKTVQHLEGGIIRSVLIREGQTVRAGDPLLHVDLGAAGLNLEEVAARLGSLRAARARLSAEAAGRLLTEEDFDAGIPETAARVELLTHRARLLEQQGQVEAARAQIDM
ncbi:MAG: HlyD family type I secretion periplasmic adaptor subunit, partial [Comamonadaceae bacterium]